MAGTIVGRRASNGQTESDGRADGIAPDSKIAFFDIGGGEFVTSRTNKVICIDVCSLKYFIFAPHPMSKVALDF